MGVSFRNDLSAPKPIYFIECHSDQLGHGGPTIGLNDSSQGVSFSGWTGGINFIDWTGGQKGSIEINQGHVTCASTCTAGTLVGHGLSMFNDDSSGAFFFDTTGLEKRQTIAQETVNRTIPIIYSK